jgi:hypothetical protein
MIENKGKTKGDKKQTEKEENEIKHWAKKEREGWLKRKNYNKKVKKEKEPKIIQLKGLN